MTENGYAKNVVRDYPYYITNKNKLNIRLIEVNINSELYTQGHLPGASYLDWNKDLNHPVKRTIVPRDKLENKLGQLGISKDTEILLYGERNNWFAAFAYWLLKLYGHENVSILNGGREYLINSGINFTNEKPIITPSSYRFPEEGQSIRALKEEILTNLGSIDLVDVRSPDEYSGKILSPPGLNETALRGGHIPTAINQPWSGVINEDGTFKTYEELTDIYFNHGINGERPIVTYCRIGERSSHSWFVLSELIGYSNVQNYDGSWTEYGNLINAPISVGSKPGGYKLNN